MTLRERVEQRLQQWLCLEMFLIVSHFYFTYLANFVNITLTSALGPFGKFSGIHPAPTQPPLAYLESRPLPCILVSGFTTRLDHLGVKERQLAPPSLGGVKRAVAR